MKNNILIKFRAITLAALPWLFIISAALMILFLTGVMENDTAAYLGIAVVMLINTAGIIANLYVKKEDMEKAFPEKNFKNSAYAVFSIVSGVLWVASYGLMVFLK